MNRQAPLQQLPNTPLPAPMSQASPASTSPSPQSLSPSAGQVSDRPVQTSAASVGPVDSRHTDPALTRLQSQSQQEVGSPFSLPLSHCSPPSAIPLPHRGGTGVTPS